MLIENKKRYYYSYEYELVEQRLSSLGISQLKGVYCKLEKDIEYPLMELEKRVPKVFKKCKRDIVCSAANVTRDTYTTSVTYALKDPRLTPADLIFALWVPQIGYSEGRDYCAERAYREAVEKRDKVPFFRAALCALQCGGIEQAKRCLDSCDKIYCSEGNASPFISVDKEEGGKNDKSIVQALANHTGPIREFIDNLPPCTFLTWPGFIIPGCIILKREQKSQQLQYYEIGRLGAEPDTLYTYPLKNITGRVQDAYISMMNIYVLSTITWRLIWKHCISGISFSGLPIVVEVEKNEHNIKTTHRHTIYPEPIEATLASKLFYKKLFSTISLADIVFYNPCTDVLRACDAIRN